MIANPSGIQCDGCGVINAGRTTLTTGKAEVENGELKGYRVKGGKVTVGQKGMDNSQSDYTDIIAEKAEIKGGVWSKKGIKVTTGKTTLTALMIQLCTWVIKTPTTLTALQTLKVKTKATVWM